LNGVCLFVAGVLRATLPTQEFTVGWMHSVEKTRWEERYRVAGSRLRLTDARIQGSGAGMEPPPRATLRDGWWTWTPARPPLNELRLTLSPFTRDYDLCWHARCRPLAAIVTGHDRDAAHSTPDAADVAVVQVRACARAKSR